MTKEELFKIKGGDTFSSPVADGINKNFDKLVDAIGEGGGGSSYVLPQATSSTLGGVKIGYSTSGKNYAVQLDGEGKMFVNVPWTDENTTYAAASPSKLGLVKQGAAVTDAAAETVTKAEFNALLVSLRNAGIIANG